MYIPAFRTFRVIDIMNVTAFGTGYLWNFVRSFAGILIFELSHLTLIDLQSLTLSVCIQKKEKTYAPHY